MLREKKQEYKRKQKKGFKETRIFKNRNFNNVQKTKGKKRRKEESKSQFVKG